MTDDFTKDPAEKLDYARDWKYRDDESRAAGGVGNGWLGVGETISSSVWTVEEGLTQDTPAPSHADGLATIWLSGGTLGENYTVTHTVTTSAGRVGKRSITIAVKAR